MENHHLKLIDSTYSVEDAKEVVQSLIHDKIKFLNRRIFSIQERFGGETNRMEQRVTELKESLLQLSDFLRYFENEDLMVEIHCQVDLKVKQSDTVEVS